MKYVIKDVMQSSGVKIGTSGARGLADEMTDQICYIYTRRAWWVRKCIHA